MLGHWPSLRLASVSRADRTALLTEADTLRLRVIPELKRAVCDLEADRARLAAALAASQDDCSALEVDAGEALDRCTSLGDELVRLRQRDSDMRLQESIDARFHRCAELAVNAGAAATSGLVGLYPLPDPADGGAATGGRVEVAARAAATSSLHQAPAPPLAIPAMRHAVDTDAAPAAAVPVARPLADGAQALRNERVAFRRAFLALAAGGAVACFLPSINVSHASCHAVQRRQHYAYTWLPRNTTSLCCGECAANLTQNAPGWRMLCRSRALSVLGSR